jgi:predicted DsbA family dithiol-disulfide isomerase
MKKLRIDVWSDIACPWCHVGKRRLEAALAAFPHRDHVEVVWRAFELDPSAPRALAAPPSTSYAARLARKYGTSVARAEGMVASMTTIASRDGLDFRFDRVRPGNTFDAHRLLHFALDRGRQDALKERLFTAYLSEGEAMSDHETLVRLAVEAGLDADEARATLASDAYAREVRADESLASRLGITGVPFFVFGGRLAVSGAQPVELFEEALARGWEDHAREDEPEPAAANQDYGEHGEGAACGPDGCS